jgi:type III secretion protein J
MITLDIRSLPIRLCALLLCCAALVGCKEELFAKLPEAQANEVLAALAEGRIVAAKDRVDEQNWRISVDKDRVGEALVYLRDRGLPQRQSPQMGEVFKKDGMISTPTEERARYKWALEESIAATLRRIEGVTDARVHVAMPHNDPLSNRPLPTSAAVFVKHRNTLDVDLMIPELKSLVMTSVEGLDYNNISFFARPVDSKPVPPTERPRPTHASYLSPFVTTAAIDGGSPDSGARLAGVSWASLPWANMGSIALVCLGLAGFGIWCLDARRQPRVHPREPRRDDGPAASDPLTEGVFEATAVPQSRAAVQTPATPTPAVQMQALFAVSAKTKKDKKAAPPAPEPSSPALKR